jgi:hypothetical protein
VKWFAASITQEQRAGKGAIFGVVANALAAEQDLPDRLLLNAAFGQLLKNVPAPLNSPLCTASRKIARSSGFILMGEPNENVL